MHKKIFLALFVIFIGATLLKAQTKTAYGFIIDSITHVPVPGIKIENPDKKYTARTNQYGQFGINAEVGNKILIHTAGYEKYTLEYTRFYYELDTIRIMLKPIVTTLKDVVVSTYTYLDYQRDSSERRQEFVAQNGTIKKLFDNNNSGVGLGISIDNLFSKREKRKRKAYKQFAYFEKEAYIRFRYNPVLVHSLTGLKGEELQKFIYKTQPTYEWLRSHLTREDIFYYINEQMKKHYP